MGQPIFAVQVSSGSYEDATDELVGYFIDQVKADAYVTAKNKKVAESNAIHEIISKLMQDFGNTHPQPRLPPTQEVPTINGKIKQGSDIYNALLAEKRKIQAENASVVDAYRKQVNDFMSERDEYLRAHLIARGIVESDDIRLVNVSYAFYVDADYSVIEVPSLD